MPFLKSHLKKFRPLWMDWEEKAIRNGFRIATFTPRTNVEDRKEKFMGEFKNDMKHGNL